MRHLVSGRKLGRTRSHRQAMLGNLATSLIIQDSKSIRTTLARAKELRPFVEKLITRAKRAFNAERNGQFPDGHVDVHSRREVAKIIHDKKALQFLFDDIAPSVLERNGGYTRIIKLGQRRGDGAEEAIIQLVDWSAQQDGAVSMNDRRRKAAKKTTAKPSRAAKAAAQDAVISELKSTVEAEQEAPVAEVVEEATAAVVEAPIAEAEAGTESAPEATGDEHTEETQA